MTKTKREEHLKRRAARGGGLLRDRPPVQLTQGMLRCMLRLFGLRDRDTRVRERNGERRSENNVDMAERLGMHLEHVLPVRTPAGGREYHTWVSYEQLKVTLAEAGATVSQLMYLNDVFVDSGQRITVVGEEIKRLGLGKGKETRV